MRRVLIIIFLLFMCLIFVCCESKTKARMRYEPEQQKRFEKQNKELRQWNFISMRKSRSADANIPKLPAPLIPPIPPSPAALV